MRGRPGRRAAHTRTDQALFGIVQGGVSETMRIESARRTVEVGFDGYGIGGLSVGETREQMLPALAAALSELPTDQPRYLMGVGDPASLVEAVALGVDQFDCVMQTRLGRHGTALTTTGRFQAKAARNAELDEPLDPTCTCDVCARHSRGYIRHLLQVGEPTGLAAAVDPQRGVDDPADGSHAGLDHRRIVRAATRRDPRRLGLIATRRVATAATVR